MIRGLEKIYSFEEYYQNNDESDNRYELIDGKLTL
ncbi:hypothetical protein CY0110_27340 [Crocosphaera chwakensis CCY0110]|uniref:Uncharacterized protein n=1 Tax=Crocosphaera chwakensis CCY0110 TaxID=391612 RepID=A3IR08_9CHRO|nr:hypothetical protein CY0110_27340 [Crocosphaera chwakensis CCY0110]